MQISKCAICQDTLTNPKSLPCLHSFCLTCLESQTKKSEFCGFISPLCFLLLNSCCLFSLQPNLPFVVECALWSSVSHLMELRSLRQCSLLTALCPLRLVGRLLLTRTMSSASSVWRSLPPPTAQSVRVICAASAVFHGRLASTKHQTNKDSSMPEAPCHGN